MPRDNFEFFVLDTYRTYREMRKYKKAHKSKHLFVDQDIVSAILTYEEILPTLSALPTGAIAASIARLKIPVSRVSASSASKSISCDLA